ncbi:MAG: cation-translocating P-type ATPase [Lachnospiraceae bacterium]
MKTWYQMTAEEALRGMESSHGGLSSGQAEVRCGQFGENVLQEHAGKKIWQVFLEQFQDLLVLILIVAAAISVLSGSGESAAVIFAVITMNAVLGTIQHEKARKSLESLKKLSAPAAQVLRDGKSQEIPAAKVVPGDIVLLDAGSLVAADGRLLECYNLQVNESSLTGESLPVEKRAGVEDVAGIPLGDQYNMVFAGSLVTGGRGVFVVTATGMETELGKIARLMNMAKEKKTPLQVSLDQFSTHLAALILGICVLVFGLSLYRGTSVLESLMFAVALAVAAIPEALGSIVTIVQAMGTQQMAREHAIIKDLKAVESLGCVSVICSDKTGTLTQNRMTVEQVLVDGRVLQPGQLRLYDPVQRYFLYGAVLDNDAVVQGDVCTGDPTEAALLAMALRADVSPEALRREMPRLGELPFDSGRKRMSTLHWCDGICVLFTKGAPDVLLERTDQILTKSGIRPMTPEQKKQIRQQNESWAAGGLRVLAVAYRPLEQMQACSLELEDSCIFLGIAAMLDPPRPESKPAVLTAKKAGIRPVMITGDHPVTALAVAEKTGILEAGDLAVTGPGLDQMTDGELDRKLEYISVYARVSPEHKIRIVEAWQRQGRIVAMTGDGVNDAPALKKADIGVAMGIMGTEVSKDAASMILTDDNFATMIKAVANGRNVYRNIRNAVQFLLSGNMAGILCVLYASILALPMPFAPVHLLFINLLTDSLPAIAIGMEPQEEGLLDQPPRDPKEGILTAAFLLRLVLQGMLIAVSTMTAYHVGMDTGGAGTASTMAFSALTLARLFHGFNCRSSHSLLSLGIRSNMWSVMAFETGTLLLAAVLFLPGLQVLFAVADLSARQLATVLVCAFVPTLLIQAVKMLGEAAA